ncbi:hypothetical protein [Sediminicola luteus]|uniref:Lipocalin-like domain-containing protein n=1 Tax=Sediminicola luteus TaxID=319238 RepID=A0A2A4G8U8_9FLAO|nr:hypothetical protein [Sediminicola luteus]PCE64841.1 hypothetical protein B7P33_06645 [Sediminicola luteus]
MDQLSDLNGYWEISQVVSADGSIKEFPVNPYVDYIKLQGTQGHRHKIKVQLGKALTIPESGGEVFTANQSGDSLVLTYKTALSEWSETLTELKPDSFTVRNETGILYRYKRYQPIIVE